MLKLGSGLSLVKKAFHICDGGEGVVFLSDREKGIHKSISSAFPNALHAFCVYHIWKNVKVKYKVTLDGLLFRAAEAPTPLEFTKTIEQMKTLHQQAGRYVEKIKPKFWARAFFPARGFGHVTSNISESMNWWLEKARHMDPVNLFCTYIRKLNKLFFTRRKELAGLPPNALPRNVEMMLTKSIEESWELDVLQNSLNIFEVQRRGGSLPFRVVDLGTMSCSCGFFREQGIPCRHMCAAIISRRQHPKAFVIRERHLDELLETYAGETVPVDLGLLQDDGLRPPTQTRRRGRPREKRIPSSAEKPPKKSVTCSRCGQRGHNKRTCKVHPK